MLKTEIMAVKSVTVLTLHPSGTARSSQRSLEPRAQMFSDVIGARIGKRDGLGTQVEDWVVSMMVYKGMYFRRWGYIRVIG